MNDIRQLCSDSEVSDDESSSGGGGARAPADETAVCCARLDDFDWVVPDRVPDILESGCATEEYLSDLGHVDEVLPDVFPVMSAGATAVPVSLPMVTEIVSSAVFVEEAAPVVAPLAEEEAFIAGMIGLIEAVSELPVELLDSERVSQDCCVVEVGVAVPEHSPVVSVRATVRPTLLGLSLYERHPWPRLGRTPWMWLVCMTESCCSGRILMMVCR